MKPVSICALVACALLSACSFHSTATRWNDRVGPDGEPVFFKSQTSIGLNFAIVVHMLGDTNAGKMVDELTTSIADEGGDHVRIIQSSSENYWYGFPPFTWILTPVITTVSADYQPADAELLKVLTEHADEDGEPDEDADAASD